MTRTAKDSEGPEGRDRGRGLRIGEVARESGVGVETLRFYERRGLLGRPRRTGANYRVYDEAVLERLAFIKRAQAVGFSLNEVTEILAESEGGGLPCRHVREMARRKLEELDRRLAELQRYRRELQSTLREWDERGEEEGRVCGLIEHSTLQAPAAAHEGLRRARRAK
jgi:DNA-binding transcriptional MerR regulator